MNVAAASDVFPYSQFEQLREAREIVRMEAEALHSVAQQLDAEFCAAVSLLADCKGCVIVLGIGKAGIIARKIAATLSSTGTRALFLHPAEAIHGDLGNVQREDVALILSNSGETEEVCRLLPFFQQRDIPIVALTGRPESTLLAAAQVRLVIGRLREAGPHGLAPTTSTTAMLAVGDALALVVARVKGFSPQLFAQHHPGGSLGQKLRTVGEMMRSGEQLRIAGETETVRCVFSELRKPGRRTGAVMLVDESGQLSGLFTDSDLARLLEAHRDIQLDRPISEVMTHDPFTITAEALLSEAVELLSRYHLSELPVIDEAGRPLGLLDITDVIGLLPA